MTTDGISTTDWRSVKALAATVANATSRNNDEAAKRGRARLLRVLDRLDLKYGPKASLLATRADYMINTKHRLRLLSEAYSIALGSEDQLNISLICASLAELYIEELRNGVEGRKWLSRLKKAVANSAGSYPPELIDELQQKLLRVAKDPCKNEFGVGLGRSR